MNRTIPMEYTVVNENFAQGKEGSISVVNINGHVSILKQFKLTKSPDRLHREASLQRAAHELGIAPEVYHVDCRAKQIFMQGIDHLLLEVAKARQPSRLLPSETQRIEQMLTCLDQNGIFHNDGNCRNVMVDHAGVLFIIDYGMSKKINDRFRKKTTSPNIRYGLEALKRSFKQNGIAWP